MSVGCFIYAKKNWAARVLLIEWPNESGLLAGCGYAFWGCA